MVVVSHVIFRQVIKPGLGGRLRRKSDVRNEHHIGDGNAEFSQKLHHTENTKSFDKERSQFDKKLGRYFFLPVWKSSFSSIKAKTRSLELAQVDLVVRM